jgi:hypothetical protein
MTPSRRIAPRPMLFLTGGRDPGSPADGIRRIAATARQAYALYDRPAHFESLHLSQHRPPLHVRHVKFRSSSESPFRSLNFEVAS